MSLPLVLYGGTSTQSGTELVSSLMILIGLLCFSPRTLTNPGIPGKKNTLRSWMDVSLRLSFHLGEETTHGCQKKLIQAIRRRNVLYKLAKSTGDFSRYKRYRNKLVNQLRLAKRCSSRRWTIGTRRNSGKLVSSCTKHLAPVSLSYQVMVKLHRPVRKKPSYWIPPLPLVLTHRIPLLIHPMTTYSPALNPSLRTCYAARSSFISSLPP